MTRTRWIALVVLVAIGIGLLVAVVAIPWGDDSPTAKAPTVYHEGDAIKVAVGEEFVVALPATPSTGYEWTAAGNPDVTFVSTHQVAGGSQPGAEGTQEMSFEGRQAGESQLIFTYARSFEKTDPPAKVAKLPLTVTK
jgi:predicted secreted protein